MWERTEENIKKLAPGLKEYVEMPRNTVIERLDDMENRQSVYGIREGLVSNGKGKYQ